MGRRKGKKKLPIVGADKAEAPTKGSEPAGKRRLPVLQPDDDDEPRPRGQWVALGAVAVVIAWLITSQLVTWIASAERERLAPGETMEEIQLAIGELSSAERLWLGIVSIGGHLLGLAIAALLGGALVGRFGGEAGKREAMFAGGIAALCGALAAGYPQVVAGAWDRWAMTAVVLIILAGLAARGGARLGLRYRR